MIHVLVSDLGNVLLPFDDGPPKRRIAKACGVADAAANFDALVKTTGLGRGLITPAAFHARAVGELGLTLDFAAFTRVYSDMFTVDAATLALIANAHVTCRVLLSNTDAFHWQWIREHYPQVLQPFDHLVTSHETHLAKPDAAIFQHACCRSGYAPSEHLFIDDLSVHVDGARRAGLQTALFTGARQLHDTLGNYGVLRV
jgi:FMN phosphatase YigB (HAD superfamily)